jgi:putative membrane protein
MLDLHLAIAHHLLILGLFGILFAELVLVRQDMTAGDAAQVSRIDRWYGVLAALILIVGFSRAVFAAKGWDYYLHNAFFWAKMATFVAVGLLSIAPTRAFIRWRRSGDAPERTEIAKIRRYLWAEVVLFALLPGFAAAMARGYGLIVSGG